MKTTAVHSKHLVPQSYGQGNLLPAFIFFILLSFPFHVFSQCGQLVWQDEFNGSSVDLTKWSFQTGDGTLYNLPSGWGNNEQQYYRAENASVSNGNLAINTKYESYGGKRYTSVRMRTYSHASWLYGKFEARIKLPSAQGAWPAFWMLPDQNNWPATGEIDIMESAGKNINYNLATLHYLGNGVHQQTHNPVYYGTPPPVNFSADFHIFTVEWSPNQIKFSVDGNVYATDTPAGMVGGAWPFNAQNFHILLNVAVGGNLGGADNPADFPTTMLVDYVRVYNLGSNCVNNAPTVSLTAPTSGQTFTAPATVNVSANAADSDGSISNVDFYNGAVLIGSDNTTPYSISWSNVAAGNYSITAKATDNLGAVATSTTANITVNQVTTTQGGNLALNRPAFSSSNESGTLTPAMAVDGNMGTRWSSLFADPQWIYVDLGANYTISEVALNWEAAYARDYKIQTSNDAMNWTDVKTITGNTSVTNDWTGLIGSGRYVRVYGTARATAYGYSLYELAVYGSSTITTTGNCGGSASNGDFTYTAASSGNNATITFKPGAPIAGTTMVILNYKVGTAANYSGIFMDASGANYMKTITAATGSNLTFYFTYRIGTTTAERNSSATPFTYIVGSTCTAARAGISSSTNSANTINVYPNPVSENMNLEFEAEGDMNAKVTITNMMSEVVWSNTYNLASGLNSLSIQAGNLDNGLYILAINANGETRMKKIQVQK
jgi:beta-glucanase (GH16 family)